MTTTPAMSPAIQPIPLSASTGDVSLKACPGYHGHQRCQWSFKEGTGFVPDLVVLYEQVRGSKVDSLYPLSRTEVLSMEFCGRCRFDYRFQEFGVKNYSAVATIKLMETWVQGNLRRKKEQEEREHQRQKEEKIFKAQIFGQRLYGAAEPPKKKSWIEFREPLAQEFVNETFEKAPVHHEQHKHGKRKPAAERRALAESRKHRTEDESGFIKNKRSKSQSSNYQGKGGKKYY